MALFSFSKVYLFLSCKHILHVQQAAWNCQLNSKELVHAVKEFIWEKFPYLYSNILYTNSRNFVNICSQCINCNTDYALAVICECIC